MGPHVRKKIQINGQAVDGHDEISIFWGVTFSKAMRVTMLYRPAMTYGQGMWHMPQDTQKLNTPTGKLTVIQTKSLLVEIHL